MGELSYISFSPTPPPERTQAIHSMAQVILSAPEFYGFKLLTKEEAEVEQNLRNDKKNGLLTAEDLDVVAQEQALVKEN